MCKYLSTVMEIYATVAAVANGWWAVAGTTQLMGVPVVGASWRAEGREFPYFSPEPTQRNTKGEKRKSSRLQNSHYTLSKRNTTDRF